MKKTHKWLAVLGLVGSPLALFLFSVAVPKVGLVIVTVIALGLGGGGVLANALGLIVLGAALAPLLLNEHTPFRQFLFALL